MYWTSSPSFEFPANFYSFTSSNTHLWWLRKATPMSAFSSPLLSPTAEASVPTSALTAEASVPCSRLSQKFIIA